MEVTKGWRGWREINTVIYEPDEISVEEMVQILKEHKTYRGSTDSEQQETV